MELLSIGHAAGLYQKSPKIIKAAIRVVQLKRAGAVGDPLPREAQPQLVLNDVDYYNVADVTDAIGWLAEEAAKDTRLRVRMEAGDE
jgi:hypothetical protein